MYLSIREAVQSKSGLTRTFLTNAPANVLALGAVSLVTDVSAEMITAVLPLYLVSALGLSLVQFGVLDGLYFGVTAAVRLAGGHAADRWRRRKLVAGLGYGLSAVAKLGLLVAGSSAVALGAVVAADRTGKGLRTAPRDALITLSAPRGALGTAFGVHRAMDTTGAFLGPLVAFAVLALTGGAYDAVFVTSFCVAVLGVLVLALFVRDRRGPVAPRPSLRTAVLKDRTFLRLCLVTTLLGLVTVSDSFVYLMLQRRLGFAPELFPLLPLGTAGAYLLLAVPFGKLADRYGRTTVFLGGHLALLAAYLVLMGPGWLVPVLLLHGLFYAATDGVLMALAGPMLPESLRTSGLALLQTGQASARMLSSVAFGVLWTALGASAGLAVVAAGLVLALVVAWRLL